MRRRDGSWVIEVPGEPDCACPAGRPRPGPARRARSGRRPRPRLRGALLPLGIEALPPDAGRPLLDAWHEGAAALPPEFGAWAAPCLSEPDPAELASLLDRGFAGACLPAEALATEAGFDGCGPLLEVLEARGAALFVHPGPAPGTLAGAAIGDADASVPSWWPALTGYVAAMNAAWHGFALFGPAPRTRDCGSASRCWPASRRSTASVWSRAAAEPPRDPSRS